MAEIGKLTGRLIELRHEENTCSSELRKEYGAFIQVLTRLHPQYKDLSYSARIDLCSGSILLNFYSDPKIWTSHPEYRRDAEITIPADLDCDNEQDTVNYIKTLNIKKGMTEPLLSERPSSSTHGENKGRSAYSV